MVRALVGDPDFGPEPIEAEPFGEIGGLRGSAVDQIGGVVSSGMCTTSMSNRILPCGDKSAA